LFGASRPRVELVDGVADQADHRLTDAQAERRARREAPTFPDSAPGGVWGMTVI
jgi:hypothetical protein